MTRCDTCGSDYEYDKSFEVAWSDGEVHTFDSFECAIQKLAPECANCGCKVIGHGAKANGLFYCGSECAELEPVLHLVRRS